MIAVVECFTHHRTGKSVRVASSNWTLVRGPQCGDELRHFWVADKFCGGHLVFLCVGPVYAGWFVWSARVELVRRLQALGVVRGELPGSPH